MWTVVGRRASSTDYNIATVNSSTVKIEHIKFAVTMDPVRRIISDATIITSSDRITHLAKAADLASMTAERVIDGSDFVATPGLCNAHIHMSYAHAVRGVFGDDLRRSEYVEKVFRLQDLMTEEEEFYTTQLAIAELMKYGTTCVLDPGTTKHLDLCVEAYDKAGIRVILGQHVLDVHTERRLPRTTTEEAIQLTEDVVRKYDRRFSGRMRAWAMPFSSGLASRDLLIGLRTLADQLNTGMTLHQNLRPEAVAEFIARYGARPVECLEAWGVLGPATLLAHVTGVDLSEVHAMARTRTPGVVCPTAAMKLGEGFGRDGLIPEMLKEGVTLSLGTDSANNSNLIDTTRAMFLVATVFKDGRRDPTAVPAECALEMATINGAKALGLDHEIGSLEVGKKADIVLFDTRRPEWRALFDPVSNLVYSADGRSVHTVIIDGRIVVLAGNVLSVDEGAVIDKVQALGSNLLERSGIVVAPRWPVV